MSTARPMKLPSGQVIWVRVDDAEAAHYDAEVELEDELSDHEPDDAPTYGSAPSDDDPSYGSAPPPPPGGGYGAAPPPPGGAPYGGAYDRSPGSAPGAPPPPALPGSGSGTAPGSGRFARRKRRPGVTSADDAQQIQGFTDAVSGIAESVRNGLMHAAPDTVEIEFGLDIDVSSGVAVSLIADARAKAAVRITLGWDNAKRREQFESQTERYEEPSSETVFATPQYAWSDKPNPPYPITAPPPYQPAPPPPPPPLYQPQTPPQQQPPYYGSTPGGAA